MDEKFKVPEFLDLFATIAERRGFSKELLCETSSGPLLAWTRERDGEGGGPLVYLSAGIHGDEPAGPLAALRLMECGDFPESHSWMICPALNPEGLELGTRENAGGADLNRGYLTRENEETAAHVAWLEEHPVPDVFVSLHEDWESRGFYFYEINLEEDRPERSEAILRAVSGYYAPEGGGLIDGHEIRGPGWIYHGAEADLPDSWPEAIYLAKRGCRVSFTFETPSRSDLETRVAAHQAAVREMLRHIGAEGDG